MNILSCGHFVLGTFCLGDVLSLGTFCPGTFCLGDILSWGQFVMGTICKGDILSGDIMSSGTFFTWGHFVHGDILSCHRFYFIKHIQWSTDLVDTDLVENFDLIDNFKKLQRPICGSLALQKLNLVENFAVTNFYTKSG